MSEHRTQYAVTYKGRVIVATFSDDKSSCEEYIERGIESTGNPASDYGIAHRAIVVEDWHPTTSELGRSYIVDAIKAQS